MPHCLVVALVPEVEPYVASLRDRFDRSARRGLGAHVTLLHAPLPDGGIDPATIAAMAGVASASAPFHYAVTGLAHFPGTLYLAVDPWEPFQELHARIGSLPIAARRPQREFIPHISVVRQSRRKDSQRVEGGGANMVDAIDALPVAEAELIPLLDATPLRCECRELVLLEDSSAAWQEVRSFPLSALTDDPWRAPS